MAGAREETETEMGREYVIVHTNVDVLIETDSRTYVNRDVE